MCSSDLDSDDKIPHLQKRESLHRAPLLGSCDVIEDVIPSSSNIDMSQTYGFAPRYAELKSARDYFEGGFPVTIFGLPVMIHVS